VKSLQCDTIQLQCVAGVAVWALWCSVMQYTKETLRVLVDSLRGVFLRGVLSLGDLAASTEVPVRSGTNLVAENTSVDVNCGAPTAAGEPNWFPSLLSAPAEVWLVSISELLSLEVLSDTSLSLKDASTDSL